MPDARYIYQSIDAAFPRLNPEGQEEVRQAFRDAALILTDDLQWARASEVYQRSDDDPQAPVVHASLSDLRLWSHVGVPEKRTWENVFRWLSQLQSGQELQSREFERVRKTLAKHPSDVWQHCRHWLSAANTWVPVERLKYRVTMQGLVRRQELFPHVREATADFTMLKAEVYATEPLTRLRELQEVIEERPANLRELLAYALTPARHEPAPWIPELGRQLQRVRFAQDPALEQRCRELARRMSDTIMVRLRKEDKLLVEPSIDGTPVGPESARDVLWYDQYLFAREGKKGGARGADR
ncbi:MAG: hypothetical protein N3C12_00950 [Candidatus Binatia bacterium]|nr:hypothetical protein [Candidatus Binatia bacterium]